MMRLASSLKKPFLIFALMVIVLVFAIGQAKAEQVPRILSYQELMELSPAKRDAYLRGVIAMLAELEEGRGLNRDIASVTELHQRGYELVALMLGRSAWAAEKGGSISMGCPPGTEGTHKMHKKGCILDFDRLPKDVTKEFRPGSHCPSNYTEIVSSPSFICVLPTSQYGKFFVPAAAKAQTQTAKPADSVAVEVPPPVKPAPREVVKNEPLKAEPEKPEPAKTEAAQAEPTKTEPVKAEAAKSEPDKTAPDKTSQGEYQTDLPIPSGDAEQKTSGVVGKAFKKIWNKVSGPKSATTMTVEIPPIEDKAKLKEMTNLCEPKACDRDEGQKELKAKYAASIEAGTENRSCINAGMIAKFDRTRGNGGRCPLVKRYPGNLGGQKFECKGMRDTLCNPLLFGAQSVDGKTAALCVPISKTTTRECEKVAEAHQKDGNWVDVMKDFNGVQEEWNQLASDLARLCHTNYPSAEYHCRECKILAKHVAKLNELHPNFDHLKCEVIKEAGGKVRSSAVPRAE